MDLDYSLIGKRIRKRRKALKLTQAQLAELAELSSTNISHIERGTTKLGLPTIVALANAMDTTVDRFLMDVVNRSEAEFRREFAELLNDCSAEEYRLLYNACETLLNTLRK